MSETNASPRGLSGFWLKKRDLLSHTMTTTSTKTTAEQSFLKSWRFQKYYMILNQLKVQKKKPYLKEAYLAKQKRLIEPL